MNDNRQMEVHFIDTGFPYTVTESFMDFFEGLTHVPVNYGHAAPMPDQESVYWSMNMNPYKYGMSGPLSPSYFGFLEPLRSPIREVNRGEWEYPSTMTTEETATTDTSSRRDGVTGMQTIPEERSPNHQDSSSTQVLWQDNIDPDNMTYEFSWQLDAMSLELGFTGQLLQELLDLSETVGTQSRGLSQELINLLPTSKNKFGSLFTRKSSAKRCVICQMTYKRGDRQMKLPCRHVYHCECISKWLSINKKCPICNAEVFGEESKH